MDDVPSICLKCGHSTGRDGDSLFFFERLSPTVREFTHVCSNCVAQMEQENWRPVGAPHPMDPQC